MFDKLAFIDKINEFMLLKGYDVKELATAANLSPSTVYGLRKGRYCQPDTAVFFKLLECFSCSADYLLGLVEFPPEDTVYYSPLQKYGARLKGLLKEKGETQKTFIENMHISSNLAYKWFSDKTLPGVDYLIKLADYFEISVDTLIERTK